MILYTCMFICNAVCNLIICDLLYIRTVSYAITLIEFISIKESIKCQELLARITGKISKGHFFLNDSYCTVFQKL